jgi:hypothetical protein
VACAGKQKVRLERTGIQPLGGFTEAEKLGTGGGREERTCVILGWGECFAFGGGLQNWDAIDEIWRGRGKGEIWADSGRTVGRQKMGFLSCYEGHEERDIRHRCMIRRKMQQALEFALLCCAVLCCTVRAVLCCAVEYVICI